MENFRDSKKKSVFWKKEVKFSNYNEKFKQYEFFDKQTNVVKSDRFESMKILDDKITLIREDYQRYFTLYQKITNISNIRKKNFFLSEKIQSLESNIELMKKIIYQKKNDLQISASIYNFNKENYTNKQTDIDKNNKKLEKYKIIFNALKNKKLMEVSYIFMNKFCGKFYLIPPFHYIKFDNNSKVMRYNFYDNNTRELSVMMGNIANMINYFSKLFNITLKYPLFVNGSRSFIVKDKKE